MTERLSIEAAVSVLGTATAVAKAELGAERRIEPSAKGRIEIRLPLAVARIALTTAVLVVPALTSPPPTA